MTQSGHWVATSTSTPSLSRYHAIAWLSEATVRRRDFIRAIVGSAALPLAGHAQQPTTPVVGFIGITTPEEYAFRVAAFRQGLKDAGFIEGQNQSGHSSRAT
jgi:hypothetical protein